MGEVRVLRLRSCLSPAAAIFDRARVTGALKDAEQSGIRMITGGFVFYDMMLSVYYDYTTVGEDKNALIAPRSRVLLSATPQLISTKIERLRDVLDHACRLMPTMRNDPKMKFAFRSWFTGGAGYIARFWCRSCWPASIGSTVLDNFFSSSRRHWARLRNPNFDLVRGDIAMRGLMTQRWQARHDVVIPLAALVGRRYAAATRFLRPRRFKSLRAPHNAPDDVARFSACSWPITNSGYGIGEPG